MLISLPMPCNGAHRTSKHYCCCCCCCLRFHLPSSSQFSYPYWLLAGLERKREKDRDHLLICNHGESGSYTTTALSLCVCVCVIPILMAGNLYSTTFSILFRINHLAIKMFLVLTVLLLSFLRSTIKLRDSYKQNCYEDPQHKERYKSSSCIV